LASDYIQGMDGFGSTAPTMTYYAISAPSCIACMLLPGYCFARSYVCYYAMAAAHAAAAAGLVAVHIYCLPAACCVLRYLVI